MDGIFILWILQGLAFGGFSAFIASNKQRDPIAWMVLGFLFSFLALLALIAVPSALLAGGGTKKCPKCAEVVKDEALICRFCQHEFPESATNVGVVEGGAPEGAPLLTREHWMHAYRVKFVDGIYSVDDVHYDTLEQAIARHYNVRMVLPQDEAATA